MKQKCKGCANGCVSCRGNGGGNGGGQGHSILCFGNVALNTFETAEYLDPGFSANNTSPLSPVQLPSPVSGAFQTLYVRQIPSVPPGNLVDIIYRVRINGIATALTLTMSTADTTKNVSANVPVSQGNLVDVEVIHGDLGLLSPQSIIVTVGLRA